jgi:tRNA(Ile)-lysidine synthase
MSKLSPHHAPSLAEQFFRPGQRICVAVSGGADSTALLRAMILRRDALGLVLSIVHVHHGIRGDEADGDQAFVEALAAAHGFPIHFRRVDTPAYASDQGETTEEAARHLRYAFFHELMDAGLCDAVATAHTLDDQAETVLHRLLRGAWTEGLGGIFPVVAAGKGHIVRPMLNVTRAEIEAWLRALGQPWREDTTNRELVYTRNRIRKHLLPILKEFNPQLATQLSRLATIARDEDAWWQREVGRVGRALLLPGKPVRGGGRASSTHPDEASIALELERLRALEPAMRRRMLRWAVLQVQAGAEVAAGLDFQQTECLMEMCGTGSSVKRLELQPTLAVQRTARELQFFRSVPSKSGGVKGAQNVELPVPGTVEHSASGMAFTASLRAGSPANVPPAVIRAVLPGDRITLRYTRGPKR